MGRSRTKDEIQENKNRAISTLDSYMTSLLDSTNAQEQSKADKLSYWILEYVKYLQDEVTFNPARRKKYKRGEVIKVNLGYNVGSEEGGLHYAIVMDKDNSVNSPTLNIIPLTSVKSEAKLQHLRKGEVYLGNELYDKLNAKYKNYMNKLSINLTSVMEIIVSNARTINTTEDSEEKLNNLQRMIKTARKMEHEISGMKKGSIALVLQATTISKLRIYDPKNTKDILSGIKISKEKLDEIDNQIIINFTK